MTYYICIACRRPMEPTDLRECGGSMYCRPMAAKRDLLPDYVESLRDDLKRAVELLEEYARHDVTCLHAYVAACPGGRGTRMNAP